jgi:hypothetical protein
MGGQPTTKPAQKRPSRLFHVERQMGGQQTSKAQQRLFHVKHMDGPIAHQTSAKIFPRLFHVERQTVGQQVESAATLLCFT